jgi:homocysteine S-methyltransferase
MTVPLHERLTQGPLLADGALGTMVYAQGVPFDRCFDALNLTEPALVGEIHRAYIEAGAELIETNTFGANRFKLATHGLQDRVTEINTAAVELARRVVEASFKPVYVGGSVGPLGVRLAPYGRTGAAQAYEAFFEQMAALVDAGVDALLIETISDLNEVAEAVKAARAVLAERERTVPVLAMMTFTQDDRTLLGDSPERAAQELETLGADLIGVNCSGGPAQALHLIQSMHREAPGVRLAVMPNAGWPTHVGGRIMYPATPEYFAEYALAFVEAGASVVGGCCGTRPEHIAAMWTALDTPPAERPAKLAVLAIAEREERRLAPDRPTQLAECLMGDDCFLIGVEMSPPKGLSTHKLLAGAHLLADAGADVINVADNPRAQMRMSAWAVCHLLQRDVGVETVLHFPTRGRNVLRVQSDLLAVHALGVRNIFVVMGDPPAIGDYPQALDAYDLVPSGLVQLIKQEFNRGIDHAGQDIGQPTSFFVGCALNFVPAKMAREIRVVRRKIEAGADFFLTQPVYDAAAPREFLRQYAQEHGALERSIMVGILPLANERHASFLHNEVPGVVIPEATQARLKKAGDRSQEEGTRIALELLEELQQIPEIRGAYLMPPFSRFEVAAEIIEAVRNWS